MSDVSPTAATTVDLALSEMEPEALFRIMRLRCDVFVVEQQCPYPELDDHDLHPATRHRWLRSPGGSPEPLAYLRVLRSGDGPQRIGRVVTHPGHRGLGLGARLLGETMLTYPGPTVLTAQSHLRDFYVGLGFAVSGPEFVEDGIPHLPMRKR